MFFKVDDYLFRTTDVCEIDVTRLVDCRVVVWLANGRRIEVVGPDAVEIVYQLKPSAMEGRRLRWLRHAWAIHNLIGHPGMQVLTWLGKPAWGLRLHEVTVPRPRLGG